MAQLIGKWKLIQAAGHPIAFPTELTFEDGKLHFRYGNSYVAPYQSEGDNLQIGPAAGTLMYI